MIKKTFPIFFLILIGLFFTACSADINTEQETAKEKVEQILSEANIEPNEELEHASLYLPVGMEVNDTDPYNLVVSKGEKLYIIHINPHENEASKVVYDTTVQTAENIRFNETFEKDDTFGFILIKDISEDLYELTVGIGGKKMTTETNTKSLAEDAEQMMEVVSSIQLK